MFHIKRDPWNHLKRGGDKVKKLVVERNDIGTLTTLAVTTVRLVTKRGCSLEDYRTIREMVKRRLSKIMEKIDRELNR